MRYPVYSHGPLLGYLMGFITLIAFSSLVAIEVVASRQYAAAWFPQLTKAGSSDPTTLGWLVQFALLCLFFVLNYRSVKTFAIANNLVRRVQVHRAVAGDRRAVHLLQACELPGAWLCTVRLVGHRDGGVGRRGDLCLPGAHADHFGGQRSEKSTAHHPHRPDPLSTVVYGHLYVLLQTAFLGGVPTEMLANGWAGISKELALPYRDIALALGVGWLAYLVVADAVISPAAAAIST